MMKRYQFEFDPEMLAISGQGQQEFGAIDNNPLQLERVAALKAIENDPERRERFLRWQRALHQVCVVNLAQEYDPLLKLHNTVLMIAHLHREEHPDSSEDELRRAVLSLINVVLREELKDKPITSKTQAEQIRKVVFEAIDRYLGRPVPNAFIDQVAQDLPIDDIVRRKLAEVVAEAPVAEHN